MASTIVSQNNLVDIIKSSQITLNNIHNYLTSVIGIVNSVKTLPATDIDKSFNILKSVIIKLNDTMSLLSNTAPNTWAGYGYTKTIQNIIHIVEDLKKMKLSVLDLLKIKLSLFLLRSVIKQLVKTTESFAYISVNPVDMVKSISKLFLVKYTLGLIVDIITGLQSVKIGFVKSFIYMIRLRRAVKLIGKIIERLSLLDGADRLLPIMGKLFVIHRILIYIQMVIDAAKQVRVGLFFFIKLRRIQRAVGKINKIIKSISKLKTLSIGRMIKLSISLILLSHILLQFRPIFLITGILAIPALIASIAIPVVLLALWGISKMLNIINRMLRARIARSAVRNVMWIGKVIYAIVLVFMMIILATPLAMLTAIAIWIVVLAIFSVAKAISIMHNIIRRVAKPRVAKGLLALLIIVTLVTIVMAMIFAMTLMAKTIAQGLGWTIVAVLGILIIGSMIVGIGLLAATLTPVMGPVLIGLIFMTVLIGVLLILATMLFLLQQLDLDKDKITHNVETVINTAFNIIELLFNSIIKIGGQDESQPWWKQVLGFFAGGLASLFTAILSIYILALSIVSVLLILFLATELRLLQEIELEPNKIKTNVEIVMSVAVMVIQTLFNTIITLGGGKKSQSWFESVIRFFAGGFATIITAILSIAILAVTIVAVLLILFLATELRVLQTINLDSEKIQHNVQTVISTALLVVNALFHGEDRESTESNKGFFRTILEAFGAGPLLMIIDAIMSIAFLALSIASIMLVNILAERLKTIQEIDLDSDKISQNIKSIIDACHTVISSVFAPDDTKGKSADGLFKKILRWCFPNLVSIIDAIMTVGFLAISMTAIGMLGEIAKHLTTLANLPSMNNIGKKVDEVMTAARVVINSVIGSGGGMDQIIQDHSAARKAETVLSIMRGAVKSMAATIEDLNKISELNENKVAIAKSNISVIVGLIDDIVLNAQVSKEDIDGKLNQAERLQSLIRYFASISPKQIENSRLFLDNYGRFIDKIGSVDLEKLKTAENMFAKMAEFSNSINGNFNKLAESLNENIAPLLEKLQDLMQELGRKVENASANISSSITAAGDDNQSSSDIEAQVKREKPGSDAKSIANEVSKRVKKQATKKSKIEEKMDTLIRMFRNQEAKVQVK